MTTATITAADIIKRCADDIAYVAEGSPAGDLENLISQLDTAAGRFSDAGINGHEDLETASTLLYEAHSADSETARDVFLRRADDLLAPVWEMVQEYREMVGD